MMQLVIESAETELRSTVKRATKAQSAAQNRVKQLEAATETRKNLIQRIAALAQEVKQVEESATYPGKDKKGLADAFADFRSRLASAQELVAEVTRDLTAAQDAWQTANLQLSETNASLRKAIKVRQHRERTGRSSRKDRKPPTDPHE
jgi:chromosome segregation ATPase